MKTKILLSVFFVLPFFLFAQTETQPKKQKPERFNPFEISPKFKPQQSDSLVFLDTLPGMPEVFVYPEIVPDKDTTDPFRMPVVIVRPDFPSNMPIMVPDSSVHYYIKQAIPVKPLPKKK